MEKVNAMNEIIDNYNVNSEIEIDNSELEDIMLIPPSDMTIADQEEFFRLLKEAILFIPVQMEKEEVFDGGDLKILQEDLFSDVTSYTCSFYTIVNGEKRTILSNSTVDMTGGTINVNGDLGRASGNGILIGNKIKSAEDLENVVWFELITTDLSGKENTYQLPLVMNKVA